MPCSIDIGGTPYPIYYGMVDSGVFTPEDLATADEPTFTAFLALLQQTAAMGQLPATTTKFLLDGSGITTAGFWWFAYPDIWGEVDATTGFQWANGDVASPTAVVEKYDLFNTPTFDSEKRLVSANGFQNFNDLAGPGSPTIYAMLPSYPALFDNLESANSDTNGWAMYTRTIVVHGITYRFYTFGVWIVEAPAPWCDYSLTPPCTSTSLKRENDVAGAYFYFDGIYPEPFWIGSCTFSGFDTGFNVNAWGWWNTVEFGKAVNWANPGPDYIDQAYFTGSITSSGGMVINAQVNPDAAFVDMFGIMPSLITSPYTTISLFVTRA